MFDEVVWRERAWNRLSRALRAGRSERNAYSRWVIDLKGIEALRVVVEWCRARSLVVEFRRRSGGGYHPDDRTIRISGRASPRVQSFILMHECGHYLIGRPKQPHERFGMGYARANDPAVNRLVHHRLDVLEEEFEAWDRGWRLGIRTGAVSEVDKKEYDEVRTSYLYSYVRWAAKTPGWELNS